MANDILLNTTTDLNGKTLVTAEGDRSITGLLTYSRGASAPFAVGSGAASVTNLDADKVDGQHAPAGTIVGTSDSQTLTNKTLTAPTLTTPNVTDSINLTGGQISFPATQVPSAGVNVLDDYEEGTWTPALGGSGGQSGQVYASQTGRYIKIGKLVWASYSITMSTLGTITTTAQIQGLPFTTDANTSPIQSVLWINMTSSLVNMVTDVVPSTTAANLFLLTVAANGWTGCGQANLANNTSLVGTIIYQASA